MQPRSPTIMSFCLVTAIAIGASSLMLAAPTRASDAPFQECTSLDDDTLSLDAEKKVINKGGKTITYTTTDRKRLRELAGYCNTTNGRYRYKTEIVGLTLQFMENGQRVKRRFRCESSEDATPAGLKCDREVNTIDWKAANRFQDEYH